MTKQNKIWTVFMSILMIIMACLIAIIVRLEPKAVAGQEMQEKQDRISELEALIEDAQFRYAIAETSKNECIESWNKEKVKLHNDAEKYRIEIKELEGFLLNR
jgi:hypothetical protein